MAVFAGNRSRTPARLILPAALAIALTGLAGCGGSADSAPGRGTASATKHQDGVTLTSGDWTLDARASASLMPGYSSAPLNFRLLTGWVNEEAAAQAGKQTDAQAQRQQALASFGLFTLEVAAGTAVPGTYRLTGEVTGADTAEVIIPLSKDAGLDGKFTSESGTLTITSVQIDEGPYVSKVVAVEGNFDGMFTDGQGATRPFTGRFRSAPE
ncbi:MAG: hypothetical protein ABIO84_00920 [Lysobacter sp.]